MLPRIRKTNKKDGQKQGKEEEGEQMTERERKQRKDERTGRENDKRESRDKVTSPITLQAALCLPQSVRTALFIIAESNAL